MKRTLGIGALMLLVLAAGCGGNKARSESTSSTRATLPAKQGSADRTSIHLYTPFDSVSVAAGIRIMRTVSGYCWSSSFADVRNDAFRCFVGNEIYDPCFAAQYGSAHYVLCPLYTPDAKVLRIDLARKLPPNSASGDPTRYPPWAVQTISGKWCTIITGASGYIAGMRVEYGCIGGGILLGNPRRATKTWTIFYASSYKASQYQLVMLRSAWW
ncbi:MAG: hypothetical protein ABSC36_06335 [Gaiellaceae bacterium]|jgi:hypothetical protein